MLNYQISWNRSRGRRAVSYARAGGRADGRTDRQRHEANSCFWQFCERAKKPPPIRIISVCPCQW